MYGTRAGEDYAKNERRNGRLMAAQIGLAPLGE